MTTFALVHGAWHGAWCWERLIPELRSRGHRVVAADLPSQDETAEFEDYADVVVAALDESGCAGGDDDLVVVGHSLGGHTLPWVALRRPVRHLVYLCALVADPGRSLANQDKTEPMLNPRHLDALSKPDGAAGGTRWVDGELARALLFGDCPDDVAGAALKRLRPQSSYPMRQRSALADLRVAPSTYVLCTDDQMVSPDWSRSVATERLGAPIVELPGGHSPFYSRPAVLADVLDRFT
jgi:pimeloyl-ACP methyl ester carboxylesterase